MVHGIPLTIVFRSCYSLVPRLPLAKYNKTLVSSLEVHLLRNNFLPPDAPEGISDELSTYRFLVAFFNPTEMHLLEVT